MPTLASGVDAILLQEVHVYADNWHCNRGLGLSAECNAKGWRVFAAHGNASDASAGCAVLIRLNSTKVKIALDANKKPKFTAALEGRFASLELDPRHGPIAWCVAPVSPAVRPFLPCVSPA
eukprot:scaffold15774_cov94-Isochrysis_galbana.AAC.1